MTGSGGQPEWSCALSGAGDVEIIRREEEEEEKEEEEAAKTKQRY